MFDGGKTFEAFADDPQMTVCADFHEAAQATKAGSPYWGALVDNKAITEFAATLEASKKLFEASVNELHWMYGTQGEGDAQRLVWAWYELIAPLYRRDPPKIRLFNAQSLADTTRTHYDKAMVAVITTGPYTIVQKHDGTEYSLSRPMGLVMNGARSDLWPHKGVMHKAPWFKGPRLTVSAYGY